MIAKSSKKDWLKGTSNRFALVHTFNYWIYACKDNLPTKYVLESREEKIELIVFPPFRSAKTNRLPAPHPDYVAMPWDAGVSPQSPNNPVDAIYLPTLPNADGKSKIVALLTDSATYKDNVFPFDSIRVDVRFKREFDENEITTRVAKFMDLFINNLRVSSRQWWIRRGLGDFNGNLRSIIPISGRGEPLQGPVGHGTVRTYYGIEKPISKEIWYRAIRNAGEGKEVNFAQDAILDAYYYAYGGQYERAVLEAAIACEVARDFVFEKLWSMISEKKFKRARLVKDNNLVNHLTKDMKKAFGWDLRSISPGTMHDVAAIWRRRNDVAHGGLLDYKRNGEEAKTIRNQFDSILRMVDLLVRLGARLNVDSARVRHIIYL